MISQGAENMNDVDQLTALGLGSCLDFLAGLRRQAAEELTLIVALFDEQGVDLLNLARAKLRDERWPGRDIQAKVDGTLMRWDLVELSGIIFTCRQIMICS